MNLVKDKWIPVKRADGTPDIIAPWEIGASDNPVVDIAAPRPDFRGALYQFLIGLVQTAFAPEDDVEWEEKWKKIPDCEELQKSFERFSEAFELTAESGPAFMQDFDMPENAKNEDVYSLFIDAPGENTMKGNKDLFVKRGTISGLCNPCFATALHTLQINASSGGAGHRTCLRGGGPLTTLIIQDVNNNIWSMIWLNILTLDKKFQLQEMITPNTFPWMGPVRDSEPIEESREEKTTRLKSQKNKTPKERNQIKRDRETAKLIYPNQVDELQQYWNTPRRIRLTGKTEKGICNCCGKEALIIKSYLSKNYGCNYSDTWQHSLSPYYCTKETNGMLSLNAFKGKEGGFCYSDWLSLTIGGDDGELAAAVVTSFNESKFCRIGKVKQIRIWCFGYDMDKDKARCWYEQTMPLILLPKAKQPEFLSIIRPIILAADDAAQIAVNQIKAAWFSRPKDTKVDTRFISSSFWETTESTFYSTAEQIRSAIESDKPTDVIRLEWRNTIISAAEKIFDRFALNATDEPRNMKRIALASKSLSIILRSEKSKSINALKEAA